MILTSWPIQRLLNQERLDCHLESRRLQEGHHQRVDSSPAVTAHTNIATAPGLSCYPNDDLFTISLFWLQTLSINPSLGAPCTTYVTPDVYVSMGTPPSVSFDIILQGEVRVPVNTKVISLVGGGSNSTFKGWEFDTHCWKSSFPLIQSNKLN